MRTSINTEALKPIAIAMLCFSLAYLIPAYYNAWKEENKITLDTKSKCLGQVEKTSQTKMPNCTPLDN